MPYVHLSGRAQISPIAVERLASGVVQMKIGHTICYMSPSEALQLSGYLVQLSASIIPKGNAELGLSNSDNTQGGNE